jgi:imidazolonepropionase-like amidohydrolase
MNDGLALRDEQARGPIDRACLYTAGQVVADKTPEDARKTVDRLADAKVDIIKIRVDGPDGSPNKMTPDIYQAVIDQAHKRGLRVIAHLFYLSDARGLLNAGVDLLAHSVRDQEVDAALIAELKRRNIAVIPTLARELSVFVYESTPGFSLGERPAAGPGKLD